MPDLFPISSDQRARFDARGVLRLPGLLSGERVRRALAHVHDRLERLGLWRDGAWRLGERPRPQWPDNGLTVSKAIDNRHPDLAVLTQEPALLAAVDALLDGRAVERELFKRPQVLISLPNIDAWTVPTGWHADAPRLASGRRPGVQLFGFLDTVAPGGGGTLVLAGSHRLLNAGRVIHAKDLRRLLSREATLRELYDDAPGGAADRARLLGPAGSVGEVEIEVEELTGAPGDAYLIDLRVLHAVAPNAAERPRLMITQRFWCADVMAELDAAHDWR